MCHRLVDVAAGRDRALEVGEIALLLLQLLALSRFWSSMKFHLLAVHACCDTVYLWSAPIVEHLQHYNRCQIQRYFGVALACFGLK
jgi:hypothetical protein